MEAWYSIIQEKGVEMKLTKDMLIADIVNDYPYLAEYIMDLGVHCIGCGAAMFETLEQGFLGHGMSDDEIDTIIIELNKIISDHEKK